eukprot:scaffold1033_cov135-Isochrysis_galbana.AAC.4
MHPAPPAAASCERPAPPHPELCIRRLLRENDPVVRRQYQRVEEQPGRLAPRPAAHDAPVQIDGTVGRQRAQRPHQFHQHRLRRQRITAVLAGGGAPSSPVGGSGPCVQSRTSPTSRRSSPSPYPNSRGSVPPRASTSKPSPKSSPPHAPGGSCPAIEGSRGGLPAPNASASTPPLRISPSGGAEPRVGSSRSAVSSP